MKAQARWPRSLRPIGLGTRRALSQTSCQTAWRTECSRLLPACARHRPLMVTEVLAKGLLGWERGDVHGCTWESKP